MRRRSDNHIPSLTPRMIRVRKCHRPRIVEHRRGSRKSTPCFLRFASALAGSQVNVTRTVYLDPATVYPARLRFATSRGAARGRPRSLRRGGRRQNWNIVQPRATIGLNWVWIGIALTIPMALGLLGAMLFWWRQRDALIGNVVGAGLIGICVLLFIWREYLELGRVRAACAEQNIACRFRPADFNRYAIYGGLGFAQVMAVFTVGLTVEERRRRRDRAPEWR